MKICYLNFNLNNPRDLISIRGLRENGVEVVEIADNAPGWTKYFRMLKKYLIEKKGSDLVMVGYAGSVLVLFLRLFTGQVIVYNSLATFYDSMIISRFRGKLFSIKSAWYYLIDFLAFRAADLIFLECQAQKDLVARVFKINPKKISVHFVGTDDQDYYFDPQVPKRKQFTVLFRGMFLAEAGVDVVIRAAKELETAGIKFLILGRGFLLPEVENLIRQLMPENIELITNRLSTTDLRKKMLACHLSLGQLADHPRVHTTIPHKAFESMAMKLPYLTGNNKGVMEILVDNQTCFTVQPGDYRQLASKILKLEKEVGELARVSDNAFQLYQQEFTPKILAQKILAVLNRHVASRRTGV